MKLVRPPPNAVCTECISQGDIVKQCWYHEKRLMNKENNNMRTRTVSRTITSVNVTAKIINRNTDEIQHKVYTLGAGVTNAQVMNAVRKQLADDEILLAIDSATTTTALYAMPESLFIEICNTNDICKVTKGE